VASRAPLRALLVIAGLALGFGFLAHAVPWADRCRGGGAVELCAPGDLEPGLRSVVATMDRSLLAAGAVLYALGALLWAKRWHFVLAVTEGAPRYGSLLRACVEAYAAMALLVGGVGGDALRLGVLVSSGVAAPWAAASLAIDRVIGLAALVAAALVVAAPELVHAYPPAVFALPALLAALTAGVAVALVAPIPSAMPSLLRRALEALRGPYGGAPKRVALAALARAFGTSLFVAATQLGAFALFLAAAHARPASVAKVVAGIVEAFVVNAIPTVPGGWGTGEAAFVFFLRPAGILEAQALAASVAFRLSVLPVAAVGVVSLALRARRSAR
jgi:uncharacterized membrane protein YbhN (UPF0104 family)